MQRHHLEEDLNLIQKYFPGATSVALRTPFDITDKLPRGRANRSHDSFHDDNLHNRYGDLLWSRS